LRSTETIVVGGRVDGEEEEEDGYLGPPGCFGGGREDVPVIFLLVGGGGICEMHLSGGAALPLATARGSSLGGRLSEHHPLHLASLHVIVFAALVVIFIFFLVVAIFGFGAYEQLVELRLLVLELVLTIFLVVVVVASIQLLERDRRGGLARCFSSDLALGGGLGARLRHGSLPP
jgi:hypothetical protein